MDYAACREALEWAEADVTAAELHGTLCALLCTRPDPHVAEWVREIVVTEHPPQGSAWAGALCDAGECARESFTRGGFDLELLLPDDDAPLAERSEALSDWCTGFLYGLGLAGGGLTASLSDDAREVVSDLTEFTRIDAEENSEDAERAYSEVVEYVRMGVLLIYEELMRAGSAAPERSRLH